MLNRKRINKGMKRTNSLPLSPVVLTRLYCREDRFSHVLSSTLALNWYLGLSALWKFFFALYIILTTREATLCSNILNAIRICAQVSKIRCYHETKKTKQNKTNSKDFSPTWPNLFLNMLNTFTTVGEF